MVYVVYELFQLPFGVIFCVKKKIRFIDVIYEMLNHIDKRYHHCGIWAAS